MQWVSSLVRCSINSCIQWFVQNQVHPWDMSLSWHLDPTDMHLFTAKNTCLNSFLAVLYHFRSLYVAEGHGHIMFNMAGKKYLICFLISAMVNMLAIFEISEYRSVNLPPKSRTRILSKFQCPHDEGLLQIRTEEMWASRVTKASHSNTSTGLFLHQNQPYLKLHD